MFRITKTQNTLINFKARILDKWGTGFFGDYSHWIRGGNKMFK